MRLIEIQHYPAVLRDAMDAVRHPPIDPARYVCGWREAGEAHKASGHPFTTARDPVSGEVRRLTRE